MNIKEIVALAGGPVKLAAALGISQPAVSSWKQVPTNHIGEVSRITGVAPGALRPDLAKLFDGEIA